MRRFLSLVALHVWFYFHGGWSTVIWGFLIVGMLLMVFYTVVDGWHAAKGALEAHRRPHSVTNNNLSVYQQPIRGEPYSGPTREDWGGIIEVHKRREMR